MVLGLGGQSLTDSATVNLLASLPHIRYFWWTNLMDVLHAMKEKRFAKQTIRRLLKTRLAAKAENTDLSGRELYKEVLLLTRQVDESHADLVLRWAEEGMDEWTAPGRNEPGFREVVHYFILSQYLAAGHRGTVVSIREIVDAMVPADI
ncbi:MAG: hypothetical protein OEY74_00720 [Gammaproteobacteria bacterium]|nr:hypothetical protein [Gammaproteobacteria bacterium]